MHGQTHNAMTISHWPSTSGAKSATENLKFVLERVESIAGIGEKAGPRHFLLFPQCVQKASFSRSLKVGIVWQRFKITRQYKKTFQKRFII